MLQTSQNMYGHQIRTLAHSYKKIINKFLKKTISKLINTVFRCSYQEHTCIFRRYILMSAVKSCGDLVVSIIGKEEGNIQFTSKKKSRVLLNCSAPDKAKLERPKPPERIPTTSQGGNPRSTEERVIHNAGAKKPIVWQIFRTCTYEFINIVRMKKRTR